MGLYWGGGGGGGGVVCGYGGSDWMREGVVPLLDGGRPVISHPLGPLPRVSLLPSRAVAHLRPLPTRVSEWLEQGVG